MCPPKRGKSKLRAIETGFSLEALALALADGIAQQHHDLVDGFLIQLLSENDVLIALHPLVREVDENALDAFSNQYEHAKRICDRTGEKSRLAAVISKHAANALVTLGHRHLQRAVERFGEAFVKSGGVPGDYSITADDAIWRSTLNLLGGDPGKWEANPLGIPYGVLSELSRLPGRGRWVDPSDWPGKIAVPLCELTNSHVIRSEHARRMDGKASFIVRQLVAAYLRTPDLLPTRTLSAMADLLGASITAQDFQRRAAQALDKVESSIRELERATDEKPVLISPDSDSARERCLSICTRVIRLRPVTFVNLVLPGS